MSTLNTAKVQVGQSGTASQNFTLLQNNDGTFSIARGNAGAPISVPFKINADNSIDGDMGVGANQTWQNFTSSRSLGITYTNSTGKSIEVAVRASTVVGGGVMLTVSGLLLQTALSGVASTLWVGATVPNGEEYVVASVGASGSTVITWRELTL